MDKKYLQLFKELARATAVSAEQVMEYNHTLHDDDGEETARIMRDDYQKLYDKMADKEFDGTLTKAEFARLFVGAYIMINQLNTRLTTIKNAIKGYETDIVPKLQKIIDATDEDYAKIAEEIFIIDSNE